MLPVIKIRFVEYALTDEQALLAKFARLIFTGEQFKIIYVTVIGQIEIVYVGLDVRGAHYILPVQADQIGIVQIERAFKRAIAAGRRPIEAEIQLKASSSWQKAIIAWPEAELRRR